MNVGTDPLAGRTRIRDGTSPLHCADGSRRHRRGRRCSPLAGLGGGVASAAERTRRSVRRATEEVRTARQDALDRRERSAQRGSARPGPDPRRRCRKACSSSTVERQTAFANDALEPPPRQRVPTGSSQIFPVAARQAIQARRRTTGRRDRSRSSSARPTRWLRVVATPAGEDGSVLVVVDRRDGATPARRRPPRLRRERVARAEDARGGDPGRRRDPPRRRRRRPRGRGAVRRSARARRPQALPHRDGSARPLPAGDRAATATHRVLLGPLAARGGRARRRRRRGGRGLARPRRRRRARRPCWAPPATSGSWCAT